MRTLRAPAGRCAAALRHEVRTFVNDGRRREFFAQLELEPRGLAQRLDSHAANEILG